MKHYTSTWRAIPASRPVRPLPPQVPMKMVGINWGCAVCGRQAQRWWGVRGVVVRNASGNTHTHSSIRCAICRIGVSGNSPHHVVWGFRFLWLGWRRVSCALSLHLPSRVLPPRRMEAWLFQGLWKRRRLCGVPKTHDGTSSWFSAMGAFNLSFVILSYTVKHG